MADLFGAPKAVDQSRRDGLLHDALERQQHADQGNRRGRIRRRSRVSRLPPSQGRNMAALPRKISPVIVAGRRHAQGVRKLRGGGSGVEVWKVEVREDAVRAGEKTRERGVVERDELQRDCRDRRKHAEDDGPRRRASRSAPPGQGAGHDRREEQWPIRPLIHGTEGERAPRQRQGQQQKNKAIVLRPKLRVVVLVLPAVVAGVAVRISAHIDAVQDAADVLGLRRIELLERRLARRPCWSSRRRRRTPRRWRCARSRVASVTAITGGESMITQSKCSPSES